MGNNMTHNISEIQKAYNVLVGGIDEKAHSGEDDGGRAYGGMVRAAKGILVEGMATNLVKVAWEELKGQEQRLTFTKDIVKIPIRAEYIKKLKPTQVADFIRANIEKFFYGHKTDVHVCIDKKFVLGIECKAYAENAMIKRILVDFTLLQQAFPQLKCVLLQLESQLTGDYSQLSKPITFGSASTHTLLSYFDVDLRIITLLDGERKVNEPIHKREYFKQMTIPALRKAVDALKELLLGFV